MDSYGFIWIDIDLYGFKLILYGFIRIYIDLFRFICILMCIHTFVVFVSFMCPISVPAALQHPQKTSAPGILEHEPCVFGQLSLLLVGVPSQHACGALATSEKHALGTLDHFSRACRRLYVLFNVFI